MVLWWWFWVSSWMSVDRQKDRARIRRVGFSAPPPERGEELEMGLLIIIVYTYVRKPP